MLQSRKATLEEVQAFKSRRAELNSPEVKQEFVDHHGSQFGARLHYFFVQKDLRMMQIFFDRALGHMWVPTSEQLFEAWFKYTFPGQPDDKTSVPRHYARLAWHASRESVAESSLPGDLKRERDRAMEERSRMSKEEQEVAVKSLREFGDV